MGSALARRLTEVALRPLGVVGTKDVPKALQGRTVRVEGLEVGDRDLNIDDGLGRKLGNGRRPNMVDAEGHGAERITEVRRLPREHKRPR